ncbi:IclR family transcriptional regulator [Streptomyces sediminimaris]|uniref:IclR family transcriptional regulator n=1 Tax=Streptomyces sediminimaris TaxID=3383721 RepID=UPI00399C2298
MPQRSSSGSAPTGTESAPSVLYKAFAILDAMGDDVRALTLSQLARTSGLPKSTVHRVVGQLVVLGVVRRHRDGYRTGPRIVALAGRTVDDVLLDVSLPRMRELRRETECVLLVSRRRGATVTYLEQLPGASDGRLAPSVAGERAAAVSTPEGRTLLAHSPAADLEAALSRHPLPEGEAAKLRRRLHDIRARGGAHNETSVIDGLRCNCVPVIVGGSPVVALSVAFTPMPGGGRRFVKPLHVAARDIARTLEEGSLRTLLPLV